MTADQEAFLNAESTAEHLVASLEKLKSEIESYGAARTDLIAVRKQLEGFIEKSAAIAANTHQVVEEIKRIGGPELLKRITEVEAALQRRTGRLLALSVTTIIIALAVAVGLILVLIR